MDRCPVFVLKRTRESAEMWDTNKKMRCKQRRSGTEIRKHLKSVQSILRKILIVMSITKSYLLSERTGDHRLFLFQSLCFSAGFLFKTGQAPVFYGQFLRSGSLNENLQTFSALLIRVIEDSFWWVFADISAVICNRSQNEFLYWYQAGLILQKIKPLAFILEQVIPLKSSPVCASLYC